jgi:serine/threonine-protein kinase
LPEHGISVNWLSINFPELSDLQSLESGGQKEVFTGVHPVDGDIVLKILFPGSDIKRFEREVDSSNIITSPRIPVIYETGTASSPVGPVMWIREQRIIGSNVRQLIREQGCLGLELILTIALHCLEVLAEAESNRIIHRDIKPDNLFIQTSSSDCWILDFGIARHLDKEALTRFSARFGLGTIGYMAPEQLRNLQAEIDSRADLFSLGVTLYECVEGVNPFLDGALDYLEVCQRIEQTPLPLITRDIEPTGELGNLIEALSRTERNHRIPSAKEALCWINDIVSEIIKEPIYS